MMDIKNATYDQNGTSITCEVEHPSLGWIPFTAKADTVDPFAQEVWEALQGMTVAAHPIPSREDQRNAAFALIDQVHASYLRDLTGGATIEERDTWKAKEEAARALVADTATPGQAAMLTAEAAGAGITEVDLAAKIIAKADTFLAIVGIAAGIRAKGRAAVIAATDSSIPDDQIGDRLDEIEVMLGSDIAAALGQIQGSG